MFQDELLPVVAAVETWAAQLADRDVVTFVDTDAKACCGKRLFTGYERSATDSRGVAQLSGQGGVRLACSSSVRWQPSGRSIDVV